MFRVLRVRGLADLFAADTIDGVANPAGSDGQARIPEPLIEAAIEAAEECPGECIFIEVDG